MKATITVDYVNQPKSPKGPGSIKSGGVYYKVWPDMLAQFQQGASYDVEYDTEMYNGKEQHTIKKARVAGQATAPSPKTNGAVPHAAKDEQIFCVALAKSYIEAGQLPLKHTELVSALKMFQVTYDQIWGSGLNDPIDGIPY